LRLWRRPLKALSLGSGSKGGDRPGEKVACHVETALRRKRLERTLRVGRLDTLTSSRFEDEADRTYRIEAHRSTRPPRCLVVRQKQGRQMPQHLDLHFEP